MNKFLISLLAIPQAQSFAPSATTRGVQRNSVQHHAAVLEGREIEGALAPTNNFILVKKAAVEDQTSGGILLTGSVSEFVHEWMIYVLYMPLRVTSILF